MNIPTSTHFLTIINFVVLAETCFLAYKIFRYFKKR